MKKSDTRTIKRDNTALVLRCLLCGADSRAQIVEQTGLSKATVTALVGELLDKGMLAETGSEGMGVGRPRTSLALVAGYAYAVGVVLHRKHLSVSLVNLALSPVDTLSFATADFKTAEEALEELYAGIRLLCERNGISAEQLIGIGISAPGPLDFKEGVILNPPGLSLFHRTRVTEFFAARTALPVYLDNNATLLAMHEKRKRQEELRHFTFIVVEDGIGSASFEGGKLLRGMAGFAGELGHISVDEKGERCACGSIGCLEKMLSPAVLRARFGLGSYHEIAEGVRRDASAAKDALAYVAAHFGRALAGLVNLLNPEAIVLYGELCEDKEIFFPPLKEELYRRSAVARASRLALMPSLLDENARIACSADAILGAYFAQKFSH